MKSTVTIVIGNSPADKFLIRGQAQTGGTTPKNFPQHLLNQAESNLAKISADGIFTDFNVGSYDDGHHDDEKSSQGTAVSGSLT